MSGDETLIFFFCLFTAIRAVATFLISADAFQTVGDRTSVLTPVAAAAAGMLVVILIVLTTLGAHDVRNDAGYVFFYLVMATAWVKLCTVSIRFLGLSFRDDCLERRNRAAAFAIAGAIIGGGCCFAGGNVGEGPGWWVVVFCAGLALGGMFACWLLLNVLAPVAESITVDRDLASGIRAAGFFVAEGFVLGRAVAGDWQSLESTILDFVRLGSPALLIVALAVVFERRERLTPTRPQGQPLRGGLLPATLMVIISLADQFLLGMPK